MNTTQRTESKCYCSTRTWQHKDNGTGMHVKPNNKQCKMSINCHQHTCCWVGGAATVLPLAAATLANAGETGGDVVVVVVAAVVCVGNVVGDVWIGGEAANNAGDGFVSSVCFEMTTVVVFWILSWSWCSAGDLGGTEVNASAARTISSTYRNKGRKMWKEKKNKILSLSQCRCAN